MALTTTGAYSRKTELTGGLLLYYNYYNIFIHTLVYKHYERFSNIWEYIKHAGINFILYQISLSYKHTLLQYENRIFCSVVWENKEVALSNLCSVKNKTCVFAKATYWIATTSQHTTIK